MPRQGKADSGGLSFKAVQNGSIGINGRPQGNTKNKGANLSPFRRDQMILLSYLFAAARRGIKTGLGTAVFEAALASVGAFSPHGYWRSIC
jgi:hypothetical protein